MMKEYKTPEIEMITYDVEDCLTGSTGFSKEFEEINGDILDQLK